MSTPFLLAYSLRVIQTLIAQERLLLSGTPQDAAKDLAAHLAGRQGHSLISSTSEGLLASDHVEELFADDEEIKDMVSELGT